MISCRKANTIIACTRTYHYMNKPTNFDINSRNECLQRALDKTTPIEVLAGYAEIDDELIHGALVLNTATSPQTVESLRNEAGRYVTRCLEHRGKASYPFFVKPVRVHGRDLVFRNALESDAAFILELRTDGEKSKHISTTSDNQIAQIEWLRAYSVDNSQVYFVILDSHGNSIGTVRLYNKSDRSFCWGSWILKQGTPSSCGIESALMVYQFAFSLGFESSHFEVRKGNESVWRFHERFGAKKVGESNDAYSYSIAADSIRASMVRYKKYLPDGVKLEY